ncbi:MAG: SGNH/GDSL hydrolase family protein [Legionellales bacterium]|nr:SGNH/GDSL hydrolase family protein [Legionellales bacterium]
MHKLLKFTCLSICLFIAPATMATTGPKLDGIVVFGDSLSDNGNLYQLKKGKVLGWPYYFGRCTNGLVWVEILTYQLHLLPNQLDDRAIAGAQTNGSHPAGVKQQIAKYVAIYPQLDPNKLYIIWIGGNNYLYHPYAKEHHVDKAINDIDDAIISLKNHGARYFLIPNLPDIGTTPLAAKLQKKHPHMGLQANLTQLSQDHDAKLAASLFTLQHTLGNNVIIMPMDVYTMMKAATTNPKKYGLINSTTACYQGAKLFAGGGTACQHPDQYLFWDIVHPTLAGHQELAALALQSLTKAGL